jgi:hypothetical protein
MPYNHHAQLLGMQVFIHDVYISVDWLGLLAVVAVLLVAFAMVYVAASLYRNRRRK